MTGRAVGKRRGLEAGLSGRVIAIDPRVALRAGDSQMLAVERKPGRGMVKITDRRP